MRERRIYHYYVHIMLHQHYLYFIIATYYYTITVLMSKTVLECVLEAYLGVYDIIHRRFKTASIIRGFSGFAGGEGT